MWPIHKIGRDAHGREISEGVHAVRPDGHIVVAKLPLKAGWRLATHEDLDESAAKEDDRRRDEQIDADDAVAEARAHSSQHGAIAREHADANAERYAAKTAAKNRNSIVLAPGPPPGEAPSVSIVNDEPDDYVDPDPPESTPAPSSSSEPEALPPPPASPPAEHDASSSPASSEPSGEGQAQ